MVQRTRAGRQIANPSAAGWCSNSAISHVTTAIHLTVRESHVVVRASAFVVGCVPVILAWTSKREAETKRYVAVIAAIEEARKPRSLLGRDPILKEVERWRHAGGRLRSAS